MKVDAQNEVGLTELARSLFRKAQPEISRFR
jgi:hypothetical protein